MFFKLFKQGAEGTQWQRRRMLQVELKPGWVQTTKSGILGRQDLHCYLPSFLYRVQHLLLGLLFEMKCDYRTDVHFLKVNHIPYCAFAEFVYISFSQCSFSRVHEVWNGRVSQRCVQNRGLDLDRAWTGHRTYRLCSHMFTPDWPDSRLWTKHTLDAYITVETSPIPAQSLVLSNPSPFTVQIQFKSNPGEPIFGKAKRNWGFSLPSEDFQNVMRFLFIIWIIFIIWAENV